METPKIYESDYWRLVRKINSSKWPYDSVQVAVRTVFDNKHTLFIDQTDYMTPVMHDVTILRFELKIVDHYTRKREWKLQTEVTIVPDSNNDYLF
jgi:hypothetical protein